MSYTWMFTLKQGGATFSPIFLQLNHFMILIQTTVEDFYCSGTKACCGAVVSSEFINQSINQSSLLSAILVVALTDIHSSEFIKCSINLIKVVPQKKKNLFCSFLLNLSSLMFVKKVYLKCKHLKCFTLFVMNCERTNTFY